MSLLFFDGENFSTLIIAALGADAMGQTGLAAIGAGHAIASFERVMRTTAIAASGSVFSLR